MKAKPATIQVPRGTVLVWTGKIKDIPKGWRRCDGRRSTVDLRPEKYIQKL